jgi:hypothetical protein
LIVGPVVFGWLSFFTEKKGFWQSLGTILRDIGPRGWACSIESCRSQLGRIGSSTFVLAGALILALIIFAARICRRMVERLATKSLQGG